MKGTGTSSKASKASKAYIFPIVRKERRNASKEGEKEQPKQRGRPETLDQKERILWATTSGSRARCIIGYALSIRAHEKPRPHTRQSRKRARRRRACHPVG